MKLQTAIIDFQNSAEKAYHKKKNIRTILAYLIALVLFLCSTILATFTFPFRFIYKQFSKNKSSKIFIGTNNNMEQLIKDNKLVLIDFWAEWCGPCLVMNPILEEFSKNSDTIKIIKVNADLNAKTLKKFNIKGLPQFLLIKDGTEIKRHAGPMTVADLDKFCVFD